MVHLAVGGGGVDVSIHTGVITLALDVPDLGEMEYGFPNRGYRSNGFSFEQETEEFKSGSVNVTMRLV